MKKPPRLAAVLALGLALSACAFGQGENPAYRLAFGDPRYKNQTVDVAPGQIFAKDSGKAILFERMILELKPASFVYIGETHDSLPMHELQARVIEALYEQERRLAVGLEMVPADRQEALSLWSLGVLTEEDFLRQTRWHTGWGFSFAYYRPVFAYAKAHGIPLYAIDAPRDVVVQLRMRDGEVLTEEGKLAPLKPDPADAEPRLMVRMALESLDTMAAFKGPGLDLIFEELFKAQAARDADISAHAIRAQKKEDGMVVILVGSGHVFYGFGLDRRIRQLSGLPSKSIVAVVIPKGRPSVTISRSLADYLVGIPEEERPAYPSIGLSFTAAPDSSGLVIARKPSSGAAQGGDFEPGDIVLSVDGRAFADAEELMAYLAGIAWGGEIRFRLLRRGEERAVILNL